jgi:hypothetical protein
VKLIIPILLLLSAEAMAQSPTYIEQQYSYFEEAQATTRAVPTTSPIATAAGPTKPLMLNRWTTYRVQVCPELGKYLDGTGKVRLYVFTQTVMTTGRWSYNPLLDQDVDITGNVVNMCQSFSFRVDVQKGFLLPATVGVGTDGTLVTVRVDPGSTL